MLKQEENERFARGGPGTPRGDLLRRYWMPVAVTGELDRNPVKPVRILGEDLTLYRDRSGGLGLIGQRCAHRLVDLRCGIPTQNGLKCPYHGWAYTAEGQCIDQPAEPPGSTFYEKVKLQAYPVQDRVGRGWAASATRPRAAGAALVSARGRKCIPTSGHHHDSVQLAAVHGELHGQRAHGVFARLSVGVCARAQGRGGSRQSRRDPSLHEASREDPLRAVRVRIP